MENTYIATQKFLRMSPRKLRLVVDAVKKMTPSEALVVLPFSGKRAAEPLSKVIKTAVANAVQAGANAETLVFAEIQIGQGPTLKRGRPVSRGQWHPIRKHMSHIRVGVKEVAVKGAKAKVQEVTEAPIVEEAAVVEKKTTKKAVTK